MPPTRARRSAAAAMHQPLSRAFVRTKARRIQRLLEQKVAERTRELLQSGKMAAKRNWPPESPTDDTILSVSSIPDLARAPLCRAIASHRRRLRGQPAGPCRGPDILPGARRISLFPARKTCPSCSTNRGRPEARHTASCRRIQGLPRMRNTRCSCRTCCPGWKSHHQRGLERTQVQGGAGARPSPPAAGALASPARINQVFMNLLLNARRPSKARQSPLQSGHATRACGSPSLTTAAA